MWRFTRPPASLLVLVSLIAAGCTGDPTRSSEYRELAAELAAAQATSESLAAEVAERDVTISELQATSDSLASDAAESEHLLGHTDITIAQLTARIETLEEKAGNAGPPQWCALARSAEPPERPFSFCAGDDLTLWVTETEMTDLLRDLFAAYADEPPDIEAVACRHPDMGSGDFSWCAARWQVYVSSSDPTYPFPKTDPALPDGVSFDTAFRLGVFIGPHSDEALSLAILDIAGEPSSLSDDPELYEEALLTVAAMLLREMGWAD